MAFPPEVFLIGAQKAGTTSLADLLGQHPEICLSSPKETHYFSQHYFKGDAWYRGHFECGDDRIFIDASTSYSLAPTDLIKASKDNPYLGVPEKIHRHAPEAKFIYILRHPVDRVYSAYWHNVRFAQEKRDFKLVVEKALNDPSNSFYLRASHYYDQINYYLEYFPFESFKILLFEHLKKDSIAVARDCFGFLSVDSDVHLTFDRPKNRAFAYGRLGKLANKMLKKYGGVSAVSKKYKDMLPRKLVRASESVLTNKIPKMGASERDRLIEHFEVPNTNLEDLLGVKLPNWRK